MGLSPEEVLQFLGCVGSTKHRTILTTCLVLVDTTITRWHGGDQRERWVGSGLLVAEKQFRRIQGYKQIPVLLSELEKLNPSKSEVAKRRKAS